MSRLSPAQRAVVARHVSGRRVHDLGAGDCSLSVELIGLGAMEVVAIDKEAMPRVDIPELRQVRSKFLDVAAALVEKPAEVAFVSWPVNNNVPGLVTILSEAEKVIYVGKNTDGSACGWPGLFKIALVTREILDHVPERRNTLIVYGGFSEGDRPLVSEEIAALSMFDGPPRPFDPTEPAFSSKERA